jgi:hypothetical protein
VKHTGGGGCGVDRSGMEDLCYGSNLCEAGASRTIGHASGPPFVFRPEMTMTVVPNAWSALAEVCSGLRFGTSSYRSCTVQPGNVT